MTRFSKLLCDEYGKPFETEVCDIEQAYLLACPHCILMADHYRVDKSCRCDDPTHTLMAEWGYVWNGKRWDAPPDEVPEYEDHN